MLFFAPMALLGTFHGLMCAIGAGELLKACRTPEKQGYFLITKVSAFCISLGFALTSMDLTLFAVSFFLLVSLFAISIKHYTEEDIKSYQTIFSCFFGGILFPTFYSSLILLRGMDWGQYLVLIPMVTSFGADSGAYFIGVLFGKHRGITKVSPNKSLEGYLGGPVVGSLAVVLYAYLLNYFTGLEVNYLLFAICGFVGSFMTALGDLSYSLIKRQTGIKDYGTLIAGHGGILDRFDGMSFSAPLIWLLLQFIPAFQLT